MGYEWGIGNLSKLDFERVAGLVCARRNASFNISKDARRPYRGIHNLCAPTNMVIDQLMTSFAPLLSFGLCREKSPKLNEIISDPKLSDKFKC